MAQKTQTLFIYPNGDVAVRIDDFLYQSMGDTITIEGVTWLIDKVYDEFDCEGWLVRKIKLSL